MKEIGIDISGNRSKKVSEFTGTAMQYAVFICASADDRCPTLAAM
jgi:arsenate reductase (thioredoxin)